MGLPYAAMGRHSGPRRVRDASSSSRFGLYTSLSELVALHSAARDIGFALRQPMQHVLAGRSLARSNLPPGGFDDVWPVPGRLEAQRRRSGATPQGAPRQTLIVVDQRLTMFFGSRRSLKSVAGAEAAALCVWRALDLGASVGGVVFNDADIETIEPQRSAAAAMSLIKAVASKNAELRAGTLAPRAPAQLEAALACKLFAEGSGSLVIVISDFFGHTTRTRDLLQCIAKANEVVAVCVYDPFLVSLPRAGDIIVSNGEVQVDMDFGEGRVRRPLFEFAEAQAQQLLAFEREVGVPVLSLSAAEETTQQMRNVLDEGLWRTGH